MRVAGTVVREAACGYYSLSDGRRLLHTWFLRALTPTGEQERAEHGTELDDAIGYVAARLAYREDGSVDLEDPDLAEIVQALADHEEAKHRRSKQNLPDAFWNSRPELAHIRQAAWARMICPDAVLGAVFAWTWTRARSWTT
jgi:hypothetical protein